MTDAKILNETMELLGKAYEITQKELTKVTDLVYTDVDQLIHRYTALTGSKAKQYYGFELHPSKNHNGFRDTDRVFIYDFDRIPDNVKEVFQTLTDIGLELKIGETGLWSSIPVNYDPETAEYLNQEAVYRFAWKNEYIEIFKKTEDVELNRHNPRIVALPTLVKVAKEWGREKDMFFLRQLAMIEDLMPTSLFPKKR